MRELQESLYGADVDYRVGSPHLQHWPLFDRLTSMISTTLSATTARGLPSSVLEVGAGHGGMTESVLARGYQVTVTEMSQASAEVIERRFHENDRFRVLHDADGSLAVLGTEKYATLLCSSVLHHIPDYLEFLVRVVPGHVLRGGSLVSVQDPLFYPRMPLLSHRFDRVAYLFWRLSRGNRWAGLASLFRRIRGAYDESKPGDMIEYHVVRSGVDEEALREWLAPRFEDVIVERYWSNQSGIAQRIGERLGMTNTFAIRATGYHGDGA